MQLVYQQEEHIELTYGSKTRRNLPETPAELSRLGPVELEHRQQLAHAPGGHAGLMQRAHVALFNGVEHACELVDAFLEQFRAGRGNGHDLGVSRADQPSL